MSALTLDMRWEELINNVNSLEGFERFRLIEDNVCERTRDSKGEKFYRHVLKAYRGTALERDSKEFFLELHV